MNYVQHVMIVIGIYLILAYSLNLVVGFGGVLSLCHALFFGLGAYTTSLLMMNADLSFLSAIFASMMMTGLTAFLIGIPAVRCREETFVIITLGFQMIAFTIFNNWEQVTGGASGISGIPSPSIGSIKVISRFEHLLLVYSFFFVILFTMRVLYKSPFGIYLKAIRDDELAATGLGISSKQLLSSAFVISGLTASLAGGLYATYVTYIDPSSFTLDESIFILAIILIGGSGNVRGPLVGTLFMILIPEILRFLGLPDTAAAHIRQILFGSALIIVMFLRPRGIAGEYELK